MSESKDNTWLWIAGIGIAVIAIFALIGRFFRITLEVVHTYQPPNEIKKETEHRKALAGFLRSKLPNCSVIEEYGKERSRADIVIGNTSTGVEGSPEKIVIELKYLLNSKAEVDRVIGQCMHYKQSGYQNVLLYLIDCEPNMVEVLKSRLQIDPLAGFVSLMEKKTEPKALQTTTTAITDRAVARSVPAVVVSDLNVSSKTLCPPKL